MILPWSALGLILIIFTIIICVILFLRKVSFELMYPSNSMSVHPLSVVSLIKVHR